MLVLVVDVHDNDLLSVISFYENFTMPQLVVVALIIRIVYWQVII